MELALSMSTYEFLIQQLYNYRNVCQY
ncbi:hypothetical protein Avbf_17606 [Armadillidium vulgare]|nr:hypothetical protein Avbf_17606 [Armadillidium vulgare]